MGKHEQIQLFNSHQVRSVWDDEQEQWYFAVSDVVQLLTDCKDATDYIKKMRKRDPELAKGWGQIVTPLSLMTKGGRQRVNCATQAGIFRMSNNYDAPQDNPQMVSESISVYRYPEQTTSSIQKLFAKTLQHGRT